MKCPTCRIAYLDAFELQPLRAALQPLSFLLVGIRCTHCGKAFRKFRFLCNQYVLNGHNAKPRLRNKSEPSEIFKFPTIRPDLVRSSVTEHEIKQARFHDGVEQRFDHRLPSPAPVDEKELAVERIYFDLAEVVESWKDLPDGVRSTIVAMVRATR